MDKFYKNIILTLLGVLLVSTLVDITYSKYIAANKASENNAHIAKFGTVEIKEHEVKYENGMYVINNESLTKSGNKYDYVIPGVDIAKDPFVTVSGIFEVSCELYVKIVKNNFPETVTFSFREDNWEAVKGENDTYKYKKEIELNKELNQDIYILKDNKLVVSQYYQGSGEFELTFSAWIRQSI
ncbi:MAG: hypothetical protein J1F31_02650 [Erysipelotrichales bacterium]|nr:hypothetical protein [Erysipelotrichales bacterium]